MNPPTPSAVQPTERGVNFLQILVLSHGGLAAELCRAARKISGEGQGLHCHCVPWEAGDEQALREVSAQIEAVRKLARTESGVAMESEEEPLLILCTLFGDTPFRAACTFIEPGKVQVLGGVNLAMLLKVACSTLPSLPFDDLVLNLRDRARSAIEVGECPAGHRPKPLNLEDCRQETA
jgi:mannose/fructose-specific phosphotransferase system component IIA